MEGAPSWALHIAATQARIVESLSILAEKVDAAGQMTRALYDAIEVVDVAAPDQDDDPDAEPEQDLFDLSTGKRVGNGRDRTLPLT